MSDVTDAVATLRSELATLESTIATQVADAESAWQTAIAAIEAAHHGSEVQEYILKRQELHFLELANALPESDLPSPTQLPAPDLAGIAQLWLPRYDRSDWRDTWRPRYAHALQTVQQLRHQQRKWVQWRQRAGDVMSPDGLPA